MTIGGFPTFPMPKTPPKHWSEFGKQIYEGNPVVQTARKQNNLGEGLAALNELLDSIAKRATNIADKLGGAGPFPPAEPKKDYPGGLVGLLDQTDEPLGALMAALTKIEGCVG